MYLDLHFFEATEF